ncbi:glycoside hydrolase superfamily [Lipomyces starkeyi]
MVANPRYMSDLTFICSFLRWPFIRTNKIQLSACLPCATALGATFDSELVFSLGRLLGLECKAKGVHVFLGPTINIQRGPLGGRGFESFSEDLVLSGLLATSYCLGLQKEDIVPTLKHLVCNDQEHERVAVSALVTQRAQREIYLLPFQIAIAGANPGVVMTSYNKLNGTHTSENPELLQGIVRNEWGYKGLLLRDWFGTYSGTEAFNAGLDLEIPGPSPFRRSGLIHAVTSNKVAEFTIDDRVRNVLELVKKTAFKRNLPGDQVFLRRAAAEPIVLLKNDDAILPLDPTKKTLGIRNRSIGEVTFTQGAYGHKELPLLGDRLKREDGQPGYIFRLFLDGELIVDNKTKQRQGTSFFGIGTPEERGSKYLEAGRPYRILVVVSFGPGGLRLGACRRIDPDQAIQDAVDLAAKADQVVVCCEGFDRTHMDLPPRSDDLVQAVLVQAVLAVQPNAVVVVQSGTPVTMPWAGQAKALLQAWYGGNETGNGIADVPFGDVNPSGKLPLSFPKHPKQNPSYLSFRWERGRVLYSEDVYLGYRYYEFVGLDPLFSFGYVRFTISVVHIFSLSNLSVSQPLRLLHKIKKEAIDVSVTIKNVGRRAGAETAQVYVPPPSTSSVRRPERELKGFQKVHLQPARSAWVSEAGDYTVIVVGTGKGNTLSAQFTVAKTRWWNGLLGSHVDDRVNGKAL